MFVNLPSTVEIIALAPVEIIRHRNCTFNDICASLTRCSVNWDIANFNICFRLQFCLLPINIIVFSHTLTVKLPSTCIIIEENNGITMISVM